MKNFEELEVGDIIREIDENDNIIKKEIIDIKIINDRKSIKYKELQQ